MSIDGILNIIKPAGVTSFVVVRLVRRWSGERRVGHAGTLDAPASGVLVVCLGQGTRVVEFLMEGRKLYRAEVELGRSTDTYDASGQVIAEGDATRVARERAEEALADFRGRIRQIPPMFSALKYKGVPLYRLARAGLEVERPPREAQVYRLDLLCWHPPVLTLEVECSRGTYIRSLAHNLGQALGCGAHLKNLVRLRSGFFDIKDGVSLSELEEAFREGGWRDLLYPVDAALHHLGAVIVAEEGEQALRQGRPWPVEGEGGRECRAYSLGGRLIALLRYEGEKGLWRPSKVFSL